MKSPRKAVRFWSSVEYNSIMGPIVRELKTIGHEAEHCFLISSLDYRTATTPKSRLWLRIRMYLFYPLHFMWNELVSPSSYCVICTNTFYTPFLSTLLRNPNRKSVHLLYDLFPDVLITAGKLAPQGIVAKTIQLIVDSTIRNSEANVALGNHLKAQIEARLPKKVPNRVIPVGTDCGAFGEASAARFPNNDPIEVLYCGNFGHLHDAETLGNLFKHPDFERLSIKFRFHGAGAGMKQLERSCKIRDKVSFEKGLPSKSWARTMSNCPIGLVTMKHGAETILLPSKTYSAMAAGQAILAICPRQSDLAELVLKHDCGWIVEPGEVKTLLRTLASITRKPMDVQSKRLNAQQAARAFYDAAPVAQQWHKLIAELSYKKCKVL